MSIIIYFYRGISLVRYLLSPAHRSSTNARWKATRPSKLIYEIGTGIMGLIVLGVLFALILRNLLNRIG